MLVVATLLRFVTRHMMTYLSLLKSLLYLGFLEPVKSSFFYQASERCGWSLIGEARFYKACQMSIGSF
jgi:hypothetical protein